MRGKSGQSIGIHWLNRIFTGLVLTYYLVSQAVLAEEVGSIAGEFAVSSGTASYSIPVQMPQGVAGMQPDVSLNYSSQSGNGYLGLGWSIGGLSMIHRCPATLAQDGVRGSVKLTPDDKFCMDGQRLIAVSGAYGAVGTEYRTEIESFSKITSVGGTGRSGPVSWIVKTKAGQTIEFGATVDSRRDTIPGDETNPLDTGLEYNIPPPNINWMINKITDAMGNSISFTYIKDDATGEQYIDRIDYAENSVQFIYEDNRPDKTKGYSIGLPVTISQRLKRVESYAGVNLIRSYMPTYEIAPTTFQSRIRSIKECVSNGECLPETSFNYDGGQFATLGYSDPPVILTTDYTKASGYQNQGDMPRYMADVDGDGLDDIVGFSSQGVSVRLSSGQPFELLPNFGKDQGWTPSRHLRMMADVDGDGLADVVGFNDDAVYYALSTGSSFKPAQRWVTGYGYADAAGGWRVDKHPRMLADVDGDGKPDIVGFSGYGVNVHLSSGGPFSALSSFGSNNWDSKNNPRELADVNGDGLADIVGFGNDGVYVSLSMGTYFAQPVMWVSGFVHTNVAVGYRRFPKSCMKQETGFWQLRELSDVNGDGLLDIVGFGMDGVYVSLSTGKAFRSAEKWSDSYGYDTGESFVLNRDNLYSDYCSTKTNIQGWSLDKHPRVLADLNADGKADIIGFADNGVYVSLSLGNAFSSPVVWGGGRYGFGPTGGGWTSESEYPRLMTDINGDGLPDIVGFSGYAVEASINPLPNPANIVSINDGNEVITAIEYKTIAGPNDHYEKQGNIDSGPPEVILPLQIPFHVVTKVSSSDGLYGTNSVTYKYGGLKAHKVGRGLLGFEWIETKNDQTEHKERTEFNQVFPHIGSPLKSVSKAADGTILTSSIVTPADKTTYVGKVHFPYASKTVSDEYELNGAHIKTAEVFNDLYDDYGNIKEMRTRVSGGDMVFETSNTNHYDADDVSKWHLGRLTSSEVTQKSTNMLSGEVLSETRTSAFTYYPATGLLWTESIEPGDAKLYQTTTYEYDGFGNKVKSTITGAGLTEPRTTESHYDTEGRYPLWTMNAKGHTENYVYDPLCGKQKTLTGPNGLPTTWTYDNFCRPETETRADGTVTTTQRYRLLDGTRYATRPIGVSASIELYPLANVLYKIVTTSTGQPTVTVYYDQLGRELRKETVGFDNRIVYQDTEYNRLGQIERASRSYYKGDPIYWVIFEYDALGRVTQQDAPTDYNARATTKTDYNGLVTTITDPKHRVSTTTKDVAGNIIRTDQPGNVFVINRYDPYGNLLETEDVKGSIVKMTYDKRGRKKTMDDPDMGYWEYDYNAVGELTGQKDNKNQEVTMEYDVLGRMKKRTEDEGVTIWNYDTQPYGKGKLASVTAPNGYSKTISYDNLGRAESSTTTINGQSYTVVTAYDAASRVKQVTRPGNFVVENVYDTNGYLLAKRSPASQVTDYSKQHLNDLKSLAITSASEALAKAEQYAVDAAYYEQWADTYRNEVAQNANVQYLTAEVAALQKHKSYKLYINQTTGALYLESPDRVMILHGEIDTPIMIPPASHYQVVPGTNSEWTLQAVDLATWSTSVLPNLADSGEHVFFGDYDGDGKTDYIRSGQNVENPLYDSALLERLAQTANEIKYVSTTLWSLADNALARANQLIAVAGQVEDRQRQAELWAENSDGNDLNEMADTASGAITYWQANTRDAEHRLTGFRQGNGLVTLRDYDPASGHLMGIQTGFDFGGNIRELEYHYDVLDNVTSRHDRVQGVSESFVYDSLDRLKKNSVSGSMGGVSYSYSTDYEYDLTGNILYKSDVGSYTYGDSNRTSGNAGPAALRSAGSEHSNYQYDLNGNLESGGGRVFQWTSFNKPKHLQKGATWVDFNYGPDRARYLKTTSAGETTVYIGKLYEEIKEGTKTTRKHFIYAGGELAAIQIKTVDNDVPQPDQTRYMHTDALGSVDTITDGFGNIVERMGFDPFGMRRAGNWKQGLPLELSAFTNRGFTGHEHVDELGIIHMNGRIYDPELGRFLSADPNIQSPLNSQSHNRYSYVWNNPLKYTDPSGFFLKKLFKKVKKFFKKWGRTILSIAVMFIPGVNIMVAGFLSGMIASGGDFRAGIIGALTAGAFNLAGGLARGTFSNALAHGVIGGVRSKLMGGKFVDGFMSGAFGSFANPVGDGFSWIGLARATVAGGVGSVLGGGKFKNGAVTAAFASMMSSTGKQQRATTDENYVSVKGRAENISAEEAQKRFDALKSDLIEAGHPNAEKLTLVNKWAGAYGDLTMTTDSYENFLKYESPMPGEAGSNVGGAPTLYRNAFSSSVNGIRTSGDSWKRVNYTSLQSSKFFALHELSHTVMQPSPNWLNDEMSANNWALERMK